MADLPANELAASRRAQPGAAAGFRAHAPRVRGARAAQRDAAAPAAPVPDLRGADLGAESAIASAHPDGAPWPRLAPGVRGRRAGCLRRAHRRWPRRHRRGGAATRRGGAPAGLRPAERRAPHGLRGRVHGHRHRAVRATLTRPEQRRSGRRLLLALVPEAAVGTLVVTVPDASADAIPAPGVLLAAPDLPLRAAHARQILRTGRREPESARIRLGTLLCHGPRLKLHAVAEDVPRSARQIAQLLEVAAFRGLVRLRLGARDELQVLTAELGR